jgi:carbon storage regulator
MLILKRGKNESITIGENTVMTILGLGGGKVRIGFTAPKSVKIHRKEVFDRIGKSEGKSHE